MLMPACTTLAGDVFHYYPAIPLPGEIICVPPPATAEEGMVMESLAGAAARATMEGRASVLVWEDLDYGAYPRWLRELSEAHSIPLRRMSLGDAVVELSRVGVIKGYVVYRHDRSERPLHAPGPMDDSANSGTVIAGLRSGLLVEESLEDRYQRLGLRKLADARRVSLEECLDRYDQVLSRRVMCVLDPRVRNARSMAIACRSMVCSTAGDAYTRALMRCEPDSPVLGWGAGDEAAMTIPSSRAGLFQTATNWCHNLTVLSTEALSPGIDMHWEGARQRPQAPPADHYVNFTITDGDNIQWAMGNFQEGGGGPHYYGNPRRGEVPYTWGLPAAGLAQLSPRTLRDILRDATPNDDFVHYNGGGYFYPDLYGADRGGDEALLRHARRLRAYCDLTGIRVITFNFQDWDGPDARRACAIFAREIPGLLGILAFQYYPYSAGEGETYWVRGAEGKAVPVVSCRKTIWANTPRPNDAPPAQVAEALNGLAAGDDTLFSWVLVHAWSAFADPETSAADASSGAAIGYLPAVWAAERLDPAVRPVRADELLLRLRDQR
jgi:hypothetical protein